MKNLKRMMLTAVVLLAVVAVRAQQMPPIPVDDKVKVGHLDNGLTYYLRHNEYPEHVASFYIAQRVGSVNEDENQRGLAHLLEHLAFNGTDHFKDNDLQEYLQSIGVEYGRNLNAYTACDQTVYYFTDVPTKRATAVDSCMMILKDWSNGITLTQKAIDDERDIVHNEYRMRMVGQMRIFERALPAMYPGSKYGVRMPIGLMSVIDGCSPEAIRSYYRKWYRPDNQAIIVVGDINVDDIEAKIKSLFGDIKVPADAAKVLPEEVPNNDEAIYIVDKDKELQADIAMMFMKYEPLPGEMKNTVAYFMQSYIASLVTSMLDQRFEEKSQEPDCPFLQAGCDDGEYFMSRTKKAISLNVVAKPGQMKEAYAAALTEAKRVHDFGFTITEYQRAKDEFMSAMEKVYENRDKMKNEEFTSQYVSNFIDSVPIPSVETEYQTYQMLSQMLPAEIVNEATKEMFAQNDTNFVTLVMMQEKEGATYPTTQELAEIVSKVRNTPVEAYVDNVKNEPLLAQAPKAGKIKKTTENTKLGYKELTLSNGARVILKKTDFKDNEILFSGSAEGGYSGMKFDNPSMYSVGGSMVDAFGVGNFNNTELQKALAGKQVSVGLSLSQNSHGISGNSTPKDIETMMQLVYLHMTALNKDEKAFNNLKETIKTILANQSNNPSMVYGDSVASTQYMNNPAYRIPTSENVDKLNADEVLNVFKSLTANAKDYTFYFVGNYDEATLLPLIETYLASLPSNGKSVKNVEVAQCKGEVKNIFEKAMANPQSQATESWRSQPQPYTLRSVITLDIAGRLLDMENNRNIREKLSAAYHAGAESDIDVNIDNKTANYTINGTAMLNPDKTAEAVPYFFSGMKQTVASPNVEDMQKAKEILLKQADVDAKTNGYWLGILSRYVKYGIDFHTDRKATIQATDAKMISNFLQNVILASGNHMEVIMNATKEETK